MEGDSRRHAVHLNTKLVEIVIRHFRATSGNFWRERERDGNVVEMY